MKKTIRVFKSINKNTKSIIEIIDVEDCIKYLDEQRKDDSNFYEEIELIVGEDKPNKFTMVLDLINVQSLENDQLQSVLKTLEETETKINEIIRKKRNYLT